MLQPAILYKEEILNKLHSTWHQDKYKWIYADGFAEEWTIDTNDWNYANSENANNIIDYEYNIHLELK